TTVEENAAAGTVVATLSAEDVDANESFTYALVDANGDALASDDFEIVGNKIQVKAGSDINFEEATSHDLFVQVTDSGGNTYQEAVTLTVTDINEDPTDITFSATTVEENAATGTVVATLSAEDVDANESFTYALVDANGDALASDDFEIVGNKIQVKAGSDINFEEATSHDLFVQVTDSGGNTYQEAVTLTVTDINEDPTDITFSNTTVEENAATGTVVATLSAEDVDANESFTYALVDANGDALASDDFEIVGNKIQVKAGSDINFEEATSHDLFVQVTDSGGNTYQEAVTLTVTDINEDPTDITFSATTVEENAATGTVVATLSAEDVDANESFTYALVDANGDALASDDFEI
ncbi:hypothetical protein CAPTEDRAFT_187674, partial [Capitella teleta]